MTKGVKKIISVLILACMLTGVAVPQTTLAAGEEDRQAAEEDQDSDLQTEEPVTEDESAQGELNAEESEDEQIEEKLSVKEDSKPEEAESENTEQEVSSNEAEDGVIEKNSHEINFILIMSPYLETPGTQQIFVSYGDGTEQVEEMTIDLQDENGGLEVLEFSKNDGTIFLFEKSFSNDSETGTYIITQVHITDDSGTQTIVLSDLGTDARFGVNEEYDGIEELEPLDGGTAEEESEEVVTATVASIDGDGEDAVEEVVNALENAENDVDLASVPQTLASKSSDIVVALDPGHDSDRHSGASGNGLKEEELTLKIAKYCKEELETYEGVSVYMTRTTSPCPYPSTSSSGADIKKRVEASVEKGAKYYVSIHINDGGADSPTAKGAEVIIPNSNWKPSVATQGKELAQAILDELEKAGMSLRSTSIYSKDSTDGSKYSDGSTTDYYSVQHNCKLNGIPGIIVEHGFISNSSDVSNFLNSDSGLKKLGVADATGIATYLGLSKNLSTPKLKSATASASGTTIKWNSVSGAVGYAVYRKPSGGSWSMIGTTTSTSYTDKESLTSGSTYYYTVRAFAESESTAMSNKYDGEYWSSYDKTGLKSVYLSTPKLTGATTGASSTTVSWNKVSGAKGYAVYRKKSDGSWSMLTTTTSTSYKDKSSLSSGKTYYYTVRAYVGSASTAKSNTYDAAYWSGYDSTGVKAVYLSTPKLSSVKSASSGTKISWGSVTGASGYAVYRKKSGGSWSMLTTTTKTSYTDKASLSGGKTYYYTVRAYKGSDSTARSNKYNAAYWSGYNSTGLKSVYLAKPKLKEAIAASSGTKISWETVTGAKGYAVYRKKSGGSWSMITTTTKTSYKDKSSLSGGKTYYYMVRAYRGSVSTAKKNKNSAIYWGGYDSTGLKSVYLANPKLGSASGTSGSVKVKWSSVSGASGYVVYRKTSGGSWKMIDTTADTSYTDKSNLTLGKTYYYTVRAYNGDETTAKANKYNAAYWSGYNSSGVSFTVPGLSTPKLSGTKVVNEGIKVSWNSVSNASGYAVFRKTSGGSWKRIGTTTGTSYTDKDGGSSGTTYYYTVRAYLGSKSDALDHKYDSAYWSSYDKSGVTGSAYEIAGTSSVTVKQMVAYFNASGKSYPSVYKSKGAATITDMAQIYYDEAKAEGIKVEVAWCQMILETGYLQFNGRVSASQCNFAGIGATDDVSTGGGATFSDVTEGVRAQIQHLKAYASTSSLNKACVDPRFNLVSRGCAKYVEILGSYENPTGNGWATGKGYGPDIVGMIKDLKKM